MFYDVDDAVGFLQGSEPVVSHLPNVSPAPRRKSFQKILQLLMAVGVQFLARLISLEECRIRCLFVPFLDVPQAGIEIVEGRIS